MAKTRITTDQVSYQPAGTGAVATDVHSKLRESVSVKDFGAVGDGVTDDTAAIQAAGGAVSSSGGGVVKWPSGIYNYTFQNPPYGVTWEMDGPEITRVNLGGSGASVKFQRARLSYIDGPHTTSQVQAEHIRTIAKGSGEIGAQYADYTLGLTIEKENWSDSVMAEPGEIDGLTIMLRNGGPNTGDDPSISGGAAILANVGQINESGATQLFEGVSNVFDRTDADITLRQLNVQIGMCNTRDADYYGLILNSNIGVQDAAIRVAGTTSSPWTWIIQGRKDNVDRYVVKDDGATRWRTAAGSIDATVAQDASGNLLFTNAAGAGIFQIPQALTNVQTGTAYTLVATDRNKTVVCGNAANITVTLPNGLGVGFTCRIMQRDSGRVTVAASGAIAVRNVNGHTKTQGQYSIIEVEVLATSGADSAWYLTGQTGA